MLPVVLTQKIADGFLRNDVEADGGLVEEEHTRAVEQGGDELHLHALAKGELADHDVQFFGDAEEGDEFVEGFFVVGGGQAVDVTQKEEGFLGGQIPPELIFLSHHEGEEAAVGGFAFGGIVSGDGGPAAGWVDEARKHFEGGGLAGAVGAEEADELALGDGKRNVLGGGELLEVAMEKTFHAAPEAGLFFVGAEDTGEVFDFDHGRRELGMRDGGWQGSRTRTTERERE